MTLRLFNTLSRNLETFEPLSENPVFSFDLPDTGAVALRVVGRDNNGNRIDAKVQP